MAPQAFVDGEEEGAVQFLRAQGVRTVCGVMQAYPARALTCGPALPFLPLTRFLL